MLNLKILIFLLFFISLDEAYNTAILNTGQEQAQSVKFLIVVILFSSQIIFAPLQAGLSDFYSRKKGLVFAFFITFLSLIFLLLFSKSIHFLCFLLFAAFLKGMAGNIVPIARASLADSIKHNFRFAIGLSTSAIAAGYLLIKLLEITINSFEVLIILIITIALILFFILNFYSDNHKNILKNKSFSLKKAIINDLKSIYKNFFKDKFFSLSALSYFFWEISFYLVFIKDIDLKSENFKNISITMCVGYLIGVFLLKVVNKWHDHHVLKLGYKISIFSVVFIFALSEVRFIFQYIPIIGYFIYSLGFGFFVPCLFSIVSKTRRTCEQGKLYGLIDSTDTLAFTFAILIDIFINSFRLIILLSFIFLLIGVFIYNKSQKYLINHEKKITI